MGLPAFTPVEPWLLAHPDRILEVHRAFVAAGSTDLLTATFRCLPGVTEGWEVLRERAIELGRQAGSDRLWLALGPGGDPGEAARGARVDGVVLETRTDPEQAQADARRVRAGWDGPLVVSLVPRADGTVPGGVAGAVAGLVAAGVDGVGFNCASVDAVIRAVAQVPDGVDVWAKPNGEPEFGRSTRSLRARARWLGGCCGAGPEHIVSVRSGD